MYPQTGLQKLMHQIFRALVAGIILTSEVAIATSNTLENPDNSENPQAEDSADNDESSVQLFIPGRLRGKRLTLRLLGHHIPLTQSRIDGPDAKFPESFEIIDRDGRIVASGNEYVTPSLLKEVRQRVHQISFGIGDSYTPSRAWSKLLLDQKRVFNTIDYVWQPNKIGVLFALCTQRNSSTVDVGDTKIDTTYISDGFKVGLRHETAPWGLSDHWSRRLHFGVTLGLVSSSHKLTYKDTHAEKTYEGYSRGGFIGYDAGYPLVNNIWVQLRGDLTIHRVTIADLGFSEPESIQSWGLGLKYTL